MGAQADRRTVNGEQVVPQLGGFYCGWITSLGRRRAVQGSPGDVSSRAAIRLAYRLIPGCAVRPCPKMLSSTVAITASRIVELPANPASRTRYTSASTIDARPLGPNQPMNSTVARLKRVPCNASATGDAHDCQTQHDIEPAADLFDSDLTSVAESVDKMWARQSHRTNVRRENILYQAKCGIKGLSLLSGLN
jgi:hypothetical protein